MPHKIAIMPYLDELSPDCRAVGACNTVYWRNSKLVGTNTDVVGVRESFLRNVRTERYLDRPGLVVGGGGAARSAVYALVKYLGCRTVYLVNRDASEVLRAMAWCKAQGYGYGLIHVSTFEQADNLGGAGAVVACVPNIPPSSDAEWEARRIVECFLAKPHKGAILEMCYHPVVWTEIAGIADKARWQVVLGTEATIYQGLEQARYWTGRNIDETVVLKVKDAVADEVNRTER